MMNSWKVLRVSFLCLSLGLLHALAQDEAPLDARRLAELEALKKEHLDLAASFSKTLEELENARKDLREARKALGLADKARERLDRERAKALESATDSPELITLREEVQELRTRLVTAKSIQGSSGQTEILVSEQTAQINDLRRRLENTDADKLKWARERAAMERQMADLRALDQAAARRRDEEAISRKQERDQRELVHARALNDLRVEIAEERARHEEVVAERDTAQTRIDVLDDELEQARADARTAVETEADASQDLERAQKQLSDAQSALASMSLELDTVKTRVEAAEREREQAVRQAAGIEALREPDAREIQTLGEKVASLNRDLVTARREADVQQAGTEEAEARIATLGEERKGFETRLAELTKSIERSDTEWETLRARAEIAERDLVTARDRAAQSDEHARQAEEARTASEEMAAQGQRALSERDADRTALAEALNRIATLEAERTALQKTDAGSREGLEALGRKVAELTGSLDESRSKCAAAEAGRDQAVHSGDALQRELEQTLAELAEARSLAERGNAALLQVETLTEQVKALQARGVPTPDEQTAPLFQP